MPTGTHMGLTPAHGGILVQRGAELMDGHSPVFVSDRVALKPIP